jgi:FKBP-type peptidyl-prolyl cis-trans isomerase 2
VSSTVQFLTIFWFCLQQYKGQDMTVEVHDTKGTVVGKAICQVSGDDVAFEINHPGAL